MYHIHTHTCMNSCQFFSISSAIVMMWVGRMVCHSDACQMSLSRLRIMVSRPIYRETLDMVPLTHASCSSFTTNCPQEATVLTGRAWSIILIYTVAIWTDFGCGHPNELKGFTLLPSCSDSYFRPDELKKHSVAALGYATLGCGVCKRALRCAAINSKEQKLESRI